MFDALGTRLQDVFQSLRGEVRLTPETTERVLRETLRLDAARIAELRAGGAFGAADVGHGLAGVA